MKSLLSSLIILMDKIVTNDKLKDIDPDLYIKIYVNSKTNLT